MRFAPFARLSALGLAALLTVTACHKKDPDPNPTPTPTPTPTPVGPSQVAFWQTSGDRSNLFRKQRVQLNFGAASSTGSTIVVDTTQTFQSIDGFGYTLTGGSAYVINRLPAASRTALLRELFATDSTWVGVSYLRLSIGASDLSAQPFTYNDLPGGQTDEPMAQFSLAPERTDLLPVLREILSINPNIKILGSPWSAPTWMKSNQSFVAGSLLPQYYPAYARYFVKYVQQMAAEGVRIDAVTVQNEPLNPYNNPSMTMTAAEQTTFIRDHLGPAFQAAGLNTKIITYDHNADRTDYPLAILADAGARAYVDGSAFHLYGGNISALTPVHDAYPTKNVYFTEQYVNSTGGSGSFGGDLTWHVNNLIIGATRNWSRNVLEWNLAADENNGPHTNGGCSTCLPAVTVTGGGNITRNQAYYIIAHASKFVRPGSVRIGSTNLSELPNVAFRTPTGKKVLIVLNSSNTDRSFAIQYRNKQVSSTLNANSVGTYVW